MIFKLKYSTCFRPIQHYIHICSDLGCARAHISSSWQVESASMSRTNNNQWSKNTRHRKNMTILKVCSTIDGILTSCLMCWIVAAQQNSPKIDYSVYNIFRHFCHVQLQVCQVLKLLFVRNFTVICLTD